MFPHPAAKARVPRPPQHGGARTDADYRECFISIAAKDRYYYCARTAVRGTRIRSVMLSTTEIP